MKNGIYLGPGGQLVEYSMGCLIFGEWEDYISGRKNINLCLQYLCRQEKYVLIGWEYLGEL